jgi:hypothetical protein
MPELSAILAVAGVFHYSRRYDYSQDHLICVTISSGWREERTFMTLPRRMIPDNITQLGNLSTALRLVQNLSWDCLSGAAIVGVRTAGTSLAAVDYQAVGEIIRRKGYGHFIAQQDFNPEPGHPA